MVVLRPAKLQVRPAAGRLKAPEAELVTGFIRGVGAGLGGEVRVTVSDIWLELISLRVGPSTAIIQQGRILTVQDLAVGQEVTLGIYNPVTLVAELSGVVWACWLYIRGPKHIGARKPH